GVAVETQLAGTPAITTDHGAFVETVEREWRCASTREFVAAGERAAALSALERVYLRRRAAHRYSLEAVAPLYERYFQRLTDRWEKGWYQRDPVDPASLGAGAVGPTGAASSE